MSQCRRLGAPSNFKQLSVSHPKSLHRSFLRYYVTSLGSFLNDHLAKPFAWLISNNEIRRRR